jgi:hypothetical protein
VQSDSTCLREELEEIICATGLAEGIFLDGAALLLIVIGILGVMESAHWTI